MKKIFILALASAAASSFAASGLYGVGRDTISGNDTFFQINTTTGAATALFQFSNFGSAGISQMTYNPVTDRFLAVQFFGGSLTQLVEINRNTSSAMVVSTGIPSQFFEGIEYSAALGGVAVSHGPGGFFSGKLALLNNSYGLISNNASTGMADGDTLFVDSAGDLNVLDTNNPTLGFQRNVINNPFGSISFSGVGANMWTSGIDYDLAWKQDENKLFLTQRYNLAIVNPSSTAITGVGSFGVNAMGVVNEITGIAVAPVPEPSTWLALGLGSLVLLRRRRR